MQNVIIHEALPSIRDDDITDVERELGVSLPDDYRRFLQVYNGGSPEPNFFPIIGDSSDDHGILQKFFCIQPGNYNNLVDYAKRFQGRVPPELLPIARDPGGNLICLAITGANKGKVYLWDHEEEVEEGEIPGYDNIYLITDSFDSLLNSLIDQIE